MDKPGAVEMVRREDHKSRGRNKRAKQTIVQKQSNRPESQCDKCGLVHCHSSNKRCPTLGRKCRYCAKYNHFEKMCRKWIKDNKSKKVNEVRSNLSDSSDLVDPEFTVSTVQHDKVTNQAFVDIGICNGTLKMKIDTGAQVNIIPTSQYYNLPNFARLQHTRKRLKAYDGSQ